MRNTRVARFFVVCLIGLWATGCFRMPAGGRTLLQPGTPAPELSAAGWINDSGSIPASIAGKVTVLDVWAYW